VTPQSGFGHVYETAIDNSASRTTARRGGARTIVPRTGPNCQPIGGGPGIGRATRVAGCWVRPVRKRSALPATPFAASGGYGLTR
jgi:hypothetical protein